MKLIPISLANLYKKKVTTICGIWRMEMTDGTVWGFTDADKNIVLQEEPNVVYRAFGGMTPSAISSSSAFNVDNLDIEGYLTDNRITESDIKAGRFDDAKVTISTLDWSDVPHSTAKIDFKREGTIGEIKLQQGKYTAEIRGLLQYFSVIVGNVFQTACRYTLFDGFCMASSTGSIHTSTVTAIQENRIITCDLDFPTDYFTNGTIMFTSGLNRTYPLEIKTWDTTTRKVELQLPANYKINIGDTFSATRGCLKTIDFCADNFNNAINFGGEPYVPQTPEMINAG